MTGTLRHRGPDDHGVAMVGPAGLGHTRLSIIDLSAAGHQPMQSEDQCVTISYNGETYNFREVRRSLEASGVQFRSRSDTEVVLRAFVRWGAATFAKLSGMFALAIWDARSQTLHLARDRFGIKPLYYAMANGALVFGSEIKAILASGRVQPEIHWQALHEYLYYGNALGAHTLFKGVRRLLPGHHLTFSRSGYTTAAYWSLESVPPVRDSLEIAAGRVRELLSEAVAAHLVSDVPVGVFLSGGIDSSAITAFASRQYGAGLKTFSVGFDFDPGTDHLSTARTLAQQCGTEHHELHIAGADMPAVIERLVCCHDEPFGDPANIPLYLLCEQLRGAIKVVLQGDGGDEMFAGYRRYNIVSFERFWRLASAVGLTLSRWTPGNPASHRARRFFRAMAQPDPALRTALLLTRETLSSPPTSTLSAEARSIVDRLDPFARYRDVAKRLTALDPVQRLLYTDVSILLPDTFLEKVDKATMAHGIEVRVPFLYAALSTYALGLPSSMKVRSGQKKWILRRALRGVIPDSILDSPKRGFSVPVDAWMRGPLLAYLRATLLDHSTANGLFDPRALELAIGEHASGRRNNGVFLYKLLNLALWSRTYLRAAPQPRS